MSRYYLLTLPAGKCVFAPTVLPDDVAYMKGQLEQGEGGLLHWQFVVGMAKECRASLVKRIWPMAHIEKTRSKAANEYVWKDETSIEGSRFELGTLPTKRNSSKDWAKIKEAAKEGRLEDVPEDIYVRCYRTLKDIARDHMKPEAMEREIYVYWGDTGTGKTRRCWNEAGDDAYPKIPTNIFWDGYKDHEKVIIDEFSGLIGITHLLRWLDRYPVIIDVKFGATVLKAKQIWITSNINPMDWYKDAPEEQKRALRRRFTRCIHYSRGLVVRGEGEIVNVE